MNTSAVTEPQIVFQAAPVRSDGVGRPAQIAVDLQPGTRVFVGSNDRVMIPLDISHIHLAGELASSDSS
jgi:hypothetical protein